MRLPESLEAMRRERGAGAGAWRRDRLLEAVVADVPSIGCGAEPSRRAFGAERERRRNALCATLFERARGVAEERLREKEAGARVRPTASRSTRRGGKKATGPMPSS